MKENNMADDRLYLRCRYCNKHILLMKFMPAWIKYPKEVEKFVDEHTSTCSLNYNFMLDLFDVFSEGSPEFIKKLKVGKK